MAVMIKHSYDERKISRYLIGGRIINSSGIINIRSESDIGSYYNAVGHNVIYEYNGNNMIIVRIDPYMASLVGSYIEKRRGGKA